MLHPVQVPPLPSSSIRFRIPFRCKFSPSAKSLSRRFSLSISFVHPLHDVLFIGPTLSHKNPPSLSSFRSRPRRILRFSIVYQSILAFYFLFRLSCSLGEYASRLLLRRSPFYFRFCLGLLRLGKSLSSSISSMSCQSLRTTLVSLDFAINSSLSRTILVSNLVPLRLVPLCLNRLHLCIRPDIYVNVFLTILSMHSSIRLLRLYLRSPHISVGNFQLLSPRLRQCTLVLRFPLLLILLGSLSVPPLQLFNTYVESVLSMELYSVPAFTFTFSSFSFSPTVHSLSRSRRRLDVDLSLTSRWVHLAWTPAGFRVCLIYRQRLDCLHSSSLSFWLLAVSHQSCAILFSFLVFSSSFSGFAFLVPRSQFDTTALLSLSIHTFSRVLVFRPLAPLSLPFLPPFRRHDVHLLLRSRMGSRGDCTHAGFRRCASSIGSFSIVLLLSLSSRPYHHCSFLDSDSSRVKHAMR